MASHVGSNQCRDKKRDSVFRQISSRLKSAVLLQQDLGHTHVRFPLNAIEELEVARVPRYLFPVETLNGSLDQIKRTMCLFTKTHHQVFTVKAYTESNASLVLLKHTHTQKKKQPFLNNLLEHRVKMFQLNVLNMSAFCSPVRNATPTVTSSRLSKHCDTIETHKNNSLWLLIHSTSSHSEKHKNLLFIFIIFPIM